ncbi:MAG: uncharacterized protein QOG55_2760 [Acidobacteriaceae bacterium]|jgi:hypothetical protein|nr:uncharacterized protein [Acidobacteriaceae bacterium]
MKRSGFADLPLHGGRVPPWLSERMTKLGSAIAENIIYNYGCGEFLSRLSDPFWFQAFGSVMGMDWHSSGITTSVVSALKRGLNPRAHELGLHVCGGRGKQSRKTPAELTVVANAAGLAGDALVRTSRLTAKIDNNAIADGFQLYLHTFIVSDAGEWAVVQQGMNSTNGLARRYHWHSASVRDFICEPHTAIVGQHQGTIMNLVDGQAAPAQKAMLGMVHEEPQKTISEAAKLTVPWHHDVRAKDVDLKRLGAVLAVAYEREPQDFASLLLLENLGPRTLQSLALIAEVVHGAPSRFSDPARFSFALGGKDRHPFPVPLKTYDESIAVLRQGLDSAKVGHAEKAEGFKRLERFVRNVEETYQPVAHFAEVVAHEHAISASLDGRSVFDDRKRAPGASTPASGGALGRPPAGREKQLRLFGTNN